MYLLEQHCKQTTVLDKSLWTFFLRQRPRTPQHECRSLSSVIPYNYSIYGRCPVYHTVASLVLGIGMCLKCTGVLLIPFLQKTVVISSNRSIHPSIFTSLLHIVLSFARQETPHPPNQQRMHMHCYSWETMLQQITSPLLEVLLELVRLLSFCKANGEFEHILLIKDFLSF